MSEDSSLNDSFAGSHSVILDEDHPENFENTEQEIVEYAVWLGMDPQKEAHLLWIASEGIKAPLPPDWKPCRSSSGDVYYFNFRSGESRWEHPADEHYKKLYEKHRSSPLAATEFAHSAPSPRNAQRVVPGLQLPTSPDKAQAGDLGDAVEARVKQQIEELVKAQGGRVAAEVASRVSTRVSIQVSDSDKAIKEGVDKEIRAMIAAGVADSEAKIKERIEATLKVKIEAGVAQQASRVETEVNQRVHRMIDAGVDQRKDEVESAAVADLRAELEMARELMVKLTASCGKRDAEMQALRAASVTSGDALEKVVLLETEAWSLRSAAESRLAEAAMLREELEQSQRDARALRDEAGEQLATAKADASEAHAEADALREHLARGEVEASGLATALRDAEAGLKAERRRVAQVSSELGKANLALGEAQKELEAEREKVAAAEIELEAEREKVAAAEIEMEAFRQRSAEAPEELALLASKVSLGQQTGRSDADVESAVRAQEQRIDEEVEARVREAVVRRTKAAVDAGVAQQASRIKEMIEAEVVSRVAAKADAKMAALSGDGRTEGDAKMAKTLADAEAMSMMAAQELAASQEQIKALEIALENSLLQRSRSSSPHVAVLEPPANKGVQPMQFLAVPAAIAAVAAVVIAVQKR